VQLTGEPMAQYVCHCDDCQAVHGKAYPVALYPASAVAVTRGETGAFTLKTTPRTKCSRCGTYIFAEVPGYPFRGVNGGRSRRTLRGARYARTRQELWREAGSLE
jgi:hypothetical protein